MRRKPNPAPGLEPLETRELLAAGLAPPPPRTAEVRASSSRSTSLRIAIRGRLAVSSAPTADGPPYSLSGRGIGEAPGLTLDGLLVNSRVEARTLAGRLTLETPRGQITLDVSGPSQPTTASVAALRYSIAGGTGSFRGAEGSGTAVLKVAGGFPGAVSESAPFILALRADGA